MAKPDELLTCEAIFDVSDPSAARRRLLAQPHIQAAGEVLVWHELRGLRRPRASKGADTQLVAGALVLGHISFHEGRLVLETTSRQALELGKTMLEALLGALLRHRVDTIEDLG